MTNSLFEEPENISWLFEAVNQNMIVIDRPVERSLNRLTPKQFILYFKVAVTEWTNLPIELETKLVPAKTLLPTQNRLNFNKSIGDQITNKWSSLDLVFSKPLLNSFDGPQPILTYASKYIYDGHHRWSQYMLSNPNANVEIINLPIIRPTNKKQLIQQKFLEYNEALDYFLVCNQLSTLHTLDEILELEKQKNDCQINLQKITEMITNNITDYCIQKLVECKQIAKYCNKEATNFYINNLKYFMPYLE